MHYLDVNIQTLSHNYHPRPKRTVGHAVLRGKEKKKVTDFLYCTQTVSDRKTARQPDRQTHTHHWNYNERYNHYLVRASSSTIIGIQERCWHLGRVMSMQARSKNKQKTNTHTRMLVLKDERGIERDLGVILS